MKIKLIRIIFSGFIHFRFLNEHSVSVFIFAEVIRVELDASDGF